MRIGIVGSREFQAGSMIRNFIFEAKQKMGDDLVIVSGGQPRGADGMAKKYALEFNVKYAEFPPAHYNWNEHCVMEAYHYGKEYRPYYYFQRNTQIAEYSDVVIAFIPKLWELKDSNGTNDTCEKALGLGKKVIVMKG